MRKPTGYGRRFQVSSHTIQDNNALREKKTVIWNNLALGDYTWD
jgi:hypothetical protein